MENVPVAADEGKWTREQIDLVKNTVGKGITDDEFKLFVYTAKRTGLDPLLHQIHPVKRWDSDLNREKMSIQTGIDGYRLIADRTGNYAPGREPVFMEKDGTLISATAFIKKRTNDGLWHDVAATAFYEEYVQKKRDGNPNRMWAKMARIMLSKCAEAMALRKAFPAEMSGVYVDDEMHQADEVQETTPPKRSSEGGAAAASSVAVGAKSIKGFQITSAWREKEVFEGTEVELFRVKGLDGKIERTFFASEEKMKQADAMKGKKVTLNYVSTTTGDFIQ